MAQIIDHPSKLSDQYRSLWAEQFIEGASHFNGVRARFNEDRTPVFLLYLIARCVKKAVRFNRKGHFTQSVDKRRMGVQPDKRERTVHAVSKSLRGRTRLSTGDFRQCASTTKVRDTVNLDPPYQGTTCGRDKRYVAQLKRATLVDALHDLNARGVSYVLSYDGQSGPKTYGAPRPATIRRRAYPCKQGAHRKPR